MCAIAGMYGLDDCSLLVKNMLLCMENRGPDSTYYANCGHFYAGMNRLSINDIAKGMQPFKNTDDSVMVFFNGEIYNYLSLKTALERDGVVFMSHCDGEVLPYLYEKYGLECFCHLEGMYGIAIWDAKKRCIILGRDVAGEKPLYYGFRDGNIVFSTLVSSLSVVLDTSLNPRAIWDFFTFGFIPEPQSIYKEVNALPKGHYLVFDAKSKHTLLQDFRKNLFKKYHFTYNKQADLVQITKEIVSKSVQDRLLSDVPLGAFLSGGLDSSIICTLASEEIRGLNTFNIAFTDDYDPYCGFANESEFARMVATKICANHTEIRVSAREYQDYLLPFICSIDQPYGAISGIGVKMVAHYAKELGIKVLLSGDGADELFGGYAWYPKLQLSDMRLITKEKPKGWHYYAFESEKRTFLSRDFFGEDLNSLVYFPSSSSKSLDFIIFDREFYLPYEMMVKVDRMTMSEGVEGRACFVSPEIMSFCHGLQYDTLLKNGEKWLLKEAFGDRLPQAILERKKHGFNAPIDYWMKNDWLVLLEEALSEGSILSKMGIINRGGVEAFMQLFYANDRRVGSIAFYFVVLHLWLGEVYG